MGVYREYKENTVVMQVTLLTSHKFIFIKFIRIKSFK